MSLITIIGRGHSGTRAISNTLSASGVYMGEPLNKSWDLVPPEEMYEACRVFAKYVDWTPERDSLNGQTFSWNWERAIHAEIPEEFKRRLNLFLHSVLESKAEHKGWKIPETTLCFPWISRLFPDAKYIFWIRNPRDCVIGPHKTDDLNNFGIPYDRMYSARGKRALSWVYQYNLVKATPKPKNWIEVRLEDFVLHQDETLARLEKFLGFPLVKLPVKPEVIDRWQQDEENLDEDPNYFEAFEPAMKEYGYAIPTTYKKTIHPVCTANYEEDKVVSYPLPDLMTFQDGTKVVSKDQWPARRKEIMGILGAEEYGHIPEGAVAMKSELQESGLAFGGKAIREQVKLTLTRNPGEGDRSITIPVLIYRPAKADKKVPAFLGLNFHGNNAISEDPAIIPDAAWPLDSPEGWEAWHKRNDNRRQALNEQFSPEVIVDHGFALATACYNNIDPDYHDCFHNGAHVLFQGPQWTQQGPEEWGTISAWAWGLSRILDYLVQQPWLDADKVCSIGHSRLGKTSLWAAANDTRFAIAFSAQAGCSGDSLAKRIYGETPGIIFRSFRHWFCPNYGKYMENEAAMPFDQHFLLATMAPRPVYVSGAAEDRWADPRGQYLALSTLDPVYGLFGKKGLNGAAMPEVNGPAIGESAGYHYKSGEHCVQTRDWLKYIAFAKRHFGME